jgi:spore coat-associated protein N
VKKLLISVLATMLMLGMIGGAFAYFTDVETSTGNTFTAGTMDLEIKDDSTSDPDPWGNGVDKTWVMENMIPGISTVTNYIALRNIGDVAEDHVEISFSNTIDEETGPPGVNPVESDDNPASQARDLAKWLQVTSMLYSGTDLKAAIETAPGYDVNGNGWLDLDDLARSPGITADHGPLDDLSPPRLTGGEASLHMTVKLNAGASNDVQGDVLTTTVTLTLNQDASQ